MVFFVGQEYSRSYTLGACSFSPMFIRVFHQSVSFIQKEMEIFEKEGWEYAPVFTAKFHVKERKMDFVRRRRWHCKMVPKEGEEHYLAIPPVCLLEVKVRIASRWCLAREVYSTLWGVLFLQRALLHVAFISKSVAIALDWGVVHFIQNRPDHRTTFGANRDWSPKSKAEMYGF